MFKDIRKKTATDKKNSESLQAASQLLGHASTDITKKHYVTDEDVIVTKPLK